MPPVPSWSMFCFLLLVSSGLCKTDDKGSSSGGISSKHTDLVAYDSADHYTSLGTTRIATLGEGLGDWMVHKEGEGHAGFFLAGEGTSSWGPVRGRRVFGLYANPPEKHAGIVVQRDFAQGMKPGEALTVDIWVDWGGGWSTSAKGLDIIDDKGGTLLTILQRETSDIFIDRHIALCPEAGKPVKLQFLAKAPNLLEVSVSQENGDNFLRDFRISGVPSGVRFFSRNTVADNPEKRQLYFGDISITGGADGEWDFRTDGADKEGVVRLRGRGISPTGYSPSWFIWGGVAGAVGGGLAFLLAGRGRVQTTVFVAFFSLLSVLLILPVWEVKYLPLGDAAAHYRQVALYSDWPANSDEYDRNLYTPYLMGTMVGGEMAKFFGAIAGYKITLTLSLLAFPIGCLVLLNILGLSRWLVWAAFPFAWHYSHIWGFYSFMVGVIPGMIMLCLVAWGRGKRGHPWPFFLGLVLASITLALSHAMAWGIFTGLGVLLILTGRDAWRGKVLCAALLILPLFFLFGQGRVEGDVAQEIQKFVTRDCGLAGMGIGRFATRGIELFSYSYGRPATASYALVGAILCLWPIMAGVGMSVSPKTILPLIYVITFFFLAPNWLFGVWIVYVRAGFLLIPASFFLYKPETCRTRWRAHLFTGMAIALSGVALLENRQFVLSTKDDGMALERIADKMPKGKNVLVVRRWAVENMFGEHRFTLPPAWVHAGGWLQAETGSNFFPDLIDVGAGAHFVMKRKDGVMRGILRPDFWWAHSWCPSNLAKYDYFLTKGSDPLPYDYLGVESGRAMVMAREGDWTLYGNLGRR